MLEPAAQAALAGRDLKELLVPTCGSSGRPIEVIQKGAELVRLVMVNTQSSSFAQIDPGRPNALQQELCCCVAV